MKLLIKESSEARKDLCQAVNNMEWNNELRTTSETVIILFDRFVEYFKNHPENVKDL